MKLSTKLPIIIATVGVVTASISGGISYFSARGSLQAAAENKLTAVLEDRASALERWMGSIENDIVTQSQNPTVIEATQAFAATWNDLPSDPTQTLQSLYITGNPNPIGAKENLDFANDGSSYSAAHADYHPYMRRFLRDRGYYDVFLFNTSGDLVYSVYKENDYATNLVNGQWAGSDLGAAFRDAKARQASGDFVFYDFKPYGPSAGAAASFIAKALKDDSGQFIGVLAFQMPVERLNNLMAQASGLGETGQSYVVGADKLLRNDVRLSDEPTLLERRVDTPIVQAVLAGQAGVSIGEDHAGDAILAAYRPIEFGEVQWGVVAEQQTREVFAPVRALAIKTAAQVAVFALLLTGVGFVIGRSITKPLIAVADAVKAVGDRDFTNAVPCTERSDEIGTIASAVQAVQGDLSAAEATTQEAVFKGSAFNGSSVAMLMVDRDLKITYINEASRELFRDKVEAFKAIWPNFDPENLVGSCIDMFHKNPEHQRRMLSDPSRLPYTTDITLGDMKAALHVSGVYDADGNYVGNTLEWKDVTDIRTNEGMLRTLDKSQALIEFDMTGKIAKANQNFLDAMGYRLDEIVGQHHRIFVDKEYAGSKEYTEFWDDLRGGEAKIAKFKRFDKNGNEVWIQAAYSPIVDVAGNAFKVLKLATDVTAEENERHEREAADEARAAEQAVVVGELARGLNALADGDLTVNISAPFGGDYEKLRADFNATVANLREVMGQIVSNAAGITTGASEISQASNDLSRRTESQAASIEQSAAALDEATASVRETAESAENANQIVATARDEAESSREIVGRAVGAMGSIEQSSNEISQIISVIDEIAFQTNLLALNAGVEAARAGDAGRGFAVVASEVRALAQRSSDAAKEIKGLIRASTDHVDNGVTMVGQAGEALQTIMNRVSEVSGLVASIAGSAKEQSRGLAEINGAVNQMDQVTQQNAAMVEEATAASHSLKTEADELLGMIAHFNTGQSTKGRGGIVSPNLSQTPRAAAPTQAVPQQQERVQQFAATQGNAALDVDEDADWDSF